MGMIREWIEGMALKDADIIIEVLLMDGLDALLQCYTCIHGCISLYKKVRHNFSFAGFNIVMASGISRIFLFTGNSVQII